MKSIKLLCFALPLVFFMACKGPHQKTGNDAISTDVNATQADSSTIAHEDIHNKAKTGIGPIKHPIELGSQIDQTMANKGKVLFNAKCATCHRIHESAVGPPLGGVLEERSPQWVMNMILNPRGMIKNNVQVQALKAKYKTNMVDLNLSKEEARQIVEYLRNY